MTRITTQGDMKDDETTNNLKNDATNVGDFGVEMMKTEQKE